MHFFRSEEHLRNWAGFVPENEGGIISLSDLHEMFSLNVVRRRLDPDYMSRYGEYAKEFGAKLQEIGNKAPYWLP